MTLTSARSITASVNPPRAVFADLPLGHTAGGPDDRDGQRHIVRAALEAAVAMETPGTIVDLGIRWAEEGWKDDPLSWRRHPARGVGSPGGVDTRRTRSPEPQYQCDEDRRLAQEVPPEEQCRVCLGLGPSG